VNRISFESAMTLQNATSILMDSTHLQMTVKSNLLGQSGITNTCVQSALWHTICDFDYFAATTTAL
jgi:hypothetical protein